MDEPYFALSRWIGGNGRSGRDVLFIGIPASAFIGNGETARNGGTGSFLITDNEGRLLGGNSPLGEEETRRLLAAMRHTDGVDTAAAEDALDRTFSVSSESIPVLGWNVIQLIPQQQLWQELGGLRNQSLLWLFGCFLAFAVIFIFFMIKFTKPLRNMVRSMDRLGEGDFHSYVNVGGRDEIAALGNHYNRMLTRLQSLIKRLSEEQKRKEEIRFQALQAQVNPHFLFNTLNSIKWMAALSGAERVSHMITKLGKLLEYTMKTQHEVVALKDEMIHLEAYLELQKIRFHDNVEIRADVPAEIESSAILKFTLQPIVENAIIHGGRAPLRIDIRATAQDDGLTITVADNGVGVSEERLQELQSRLNHNHARYSGIGLHNVNERIKMHFGAEYGIDIGNLPDEGAIVTIRLPLREADDSAGTSHSSTLDRKEAPL